jgi:glycosyltransferase involved in cell wall biosynthesis
MPTGPNHHSRSTQWEPRVAIVHDWLPLYAGAERVLEQIIKVYPQADLFSLIDLIPPGQRAFLADKPVQTSFLQKWKWVRERYRSFLPLMPLAVEQFDLSQYDLIISSSYAVAKGIITGPDQVHICYCHSPMRYAWDLQHQYLKTAKLEHGLKSWVARAVLHYMRMWDAIGHTRVDHFIANSNFVARRIRKTYGREAVVIHPPVDVEGFPLERSKENYYLTVSRLVPYKMVSMVVEAFTKMPHLELRVIGEGPEFENIRKQAGPNVKMLGYQSGEVVREQMQKAKAFVFAGEEDFGIVPVEAQACGTPVIAYGKGGVLETIVPGETGMFFYEQTPASLCEAVQEFEADAQTLDSSTIRENALRFSNARFREEFAARAGALWQAFAYPAAAPRGSVTPPPGALIKLAMVPGAPISELITESVDDAEQAGREDPQDLKTPSIG